MQTLHNIPKEKTVPELTEAQRNSIRGLSGAYPDEYYIYGICKGDLWVWDLPTYPVEDRYWTLLDEQNYWVSQGQHHPNFDFSEVIVHNLPDDFNAATYVPT